MASCVEGANLSHLDDILETHWAVCGKVGRISIGSIVGQQSLDLAQDVIDLCLSFLWRVVRGSQERRQE